ncbi:TPA: Ig-like domain-containing protein [Enterobacter hormaechei]|nr:Ig-like domain-containing protein [Enterobacter hormaechei]
MINKRTFGFHLTAWLIVCLQLFTPLFFTAASVARAAAVSQPGLPELGTPKQEKTDDSDKTTDRVIAAQAARAGQVLSSDDSGFAAQSYAQGLAASAINQEISDWLAQRGTARVSVGSHQKVSGDILYAFYSNDDYLFYAQGGVRAAEDRNTTNFGLGYRQNAGDWLLGINAFYDYDYTGKNARMGVGTEAWTDYLRFAANGYFRITNWHASRIDAMRDYDERPANGFDVRAEGWLPALPQVGGRLKYEQYFGEGVYLGNSSVTTDKLRSDPKALTMGLTWTPVPLVTLTGEQSTGDSHDSRVGLDFTWRFDVPLSQQLSPDAVQTLRSIKASRYELVDRNYDITMQYRKQSLLSISLPDVVTAESLQTVRIPVTVNKAKYGLKDTQWTPSASFTAAGGTFRKVSETVLEVKVPAYTASATARSAVQEYTFSATGTDSNGNRSNTATTILRVMPSQLSISALTVSPADGVPADNAQFATLTATVTDSSGQPAGAQAVTFTLSGLTGGTGGAAGTLFTDGVSDSQQLTVMTGADGKANVRVRSSVAGTATITATTQGGDNKAVTVPFTDLKLQAVIAEGDLKVSQNAPANGTSADHVTIKVTDGKGNVVPGVTLQLSVADGASVTPASVMSNAQGLAEADITSRKAGTYTLTVLLKESGKTASADAVFVADITTAAVRAGDLTVTQDSALADGTARNAVQAKVTDAAGNTVAGQSVTFSATNGAVLTATTVVSDANGVAVTALTSLTAGTSAVTATLNGSSQTVETTFVSATADAEITADNLIISPDNAAANGTARNGVTATVTNAAGNVVSGAEVTFSVSSGATVTTLTGTTGADGKATAAVTSLIAGSYTVTASVNGRATTKTTTFIADASTATITSSNMVVTTDNSPANGTDQNRLQVRVTDANGNSVPGATVSFAGTAGATLTASTGTTNQSGETTVALTSTTAGTYTVTASVNGNSMTKDVTFIPDTSTAEVTSANLIIDPDGAVASGTATNGVMATVTDGAGNPVPGISVSLGVSSGAIITPATVTSDGNGKVTATVTSTTAGTYTVSAQAAGSSTVATKTTTFVADVTGATIELVASDPQASYVVGNQVVYTATARDAGGNVITGTTFNVSASGSASTQAQITGVSNGVATLYVTDTKSGTVNLTVSLQNAGTINASDSVTFIADSSTARVEEGNLVVTSDGALADRVESNTVVATVTDQYGNIVPDFGRIDFNVSPVTGGGSSNISWESTTNSAGQSLMTVTSTSPKDYRVTVNINGVEQSPVKIMNFAAKLYALAVSQNDAPADGVSTNEVRARAVYPTQNTGLAGVAITFRANNGGIISEGTVLTDSSGFATTTLTSLTSGTVTVTASIAARTPQELTVDTTFIEP